VGTEQIESALRACYPLAAVDRLDRDAAQRVGAQRRILHAWRAGDTDILVGTQMVSKGHDVPSVTLVAVLIADLSLNVPDFRAAERTLQLRRQARALGLDDQAVLGPAPPPLERLRGRYRWQCLLRSADVRALRTLARVARAADATMRRARLRLAIDVDPYAML